MNKTLLVGGTLGLGALAVWGLGKDSVEERWQQSPGTRGLLNLDAVQEAFKKNQNIQAFEKRINEVFEGDNLILLDLRKTNANEKGFELMGKEDLNGNHQIDSQDELLFKLTVSKGKAHLEGFGVNRNYSASWPYNPEQYPIEEEDQQQGRLGNHYYPYHGFHSYYLWGGRGYSTPWSHQEGILGHRNQYRQTSQFQQQVNQNDSFQTQQAKQHGSRFTQAQESPSKQRSQYIQSKMQSDTFRSSLASQQSQSGWGARQASGKSTSGGAKTSGFSKTVSSFKSAAGVRV